VRVRVAEGCDTAEAWNRSAGPARRPTEPPSGPGRPLDPEVERILKMVEAGELTAREADDLLRALNHE
jgi:hypothetical protein